MINDLLYYVLNFQVVMKMMLIMERSSPTQGLVGGTCQVTRGQLSRVVTRN